MIQKQKVYPRRNQEATVPGTFIGQTQTGEIVMMENLQNIYTVSFSRAFLCLRCNASKRKKERGKTDLTNLASAFPARKL
jgi:hypothetical protein